MTRTLAASLILAAAAALPGSPAPAQVPDSLPQDTVLPVSPGGAMIRSMILPGWGQSEFQAYFRGGIYFAGWTGDWFMIFRNDYRLDDARAKYHNRADQIEAGLIGSSSNPDSMRAQIDSFPDLLDSAIREDSLGNELRKLVSARRQQRQDWIAWSLFWVLASGIDAFVTAHLADFPAAVELRPAGQGAVSLQVSVPLAPTRPRPRPSPPPHLPRPPDRGS